MGTVCFAMRYIVCVFSFLPYIPLSISIRDCCLIHPFTSFPPSAPNLYCTPHLFLWDRFTWCPALIPFVHPRRVVIFESREPRRRFDCGTPPRSKRVWGGRDAMRSESGVEIYSRRRCTCKRVMLGMPTSQWWYSPRPVKYNRDNGARREGRSREKIGDGAGFERTAARASLN